MAVVWEFVSELGVHVKVCDDCYKDISSEELAKRYKHISDVIGKINERVQRRAMENKQDQGENKKVYE